MRSARAGAPGWDIACPSRPGRLPGVRMAGFSDQTTGPDDVRVVPPPAVMVVIDIGGGLLVGDASGQQQRGSVVAGLAPVGAAGRGPENFECLQMRLSPVVAHAALGDCAELSGAVVALDDLWGREAVRLQEQLLAAASWQDRFALAEAVLARRHETSRAVDPEVAFAWRQLVASGGQVRVELLAAEAGWSRKRLWSRFRSQIGVTPKRAARLVRFDRAARLLAAGRSAAAVAADSGYADQSHLHRDVLAFAGMTPAAMAVTPFLAVDDVAWPGAMSAART